MRLEATCEQVALKISQSSATENSEMISKLLHSNIPPTAVETRAENLINGKDAELFVAISIISAFRAELSWGSSTDDDSKIDIRASYSHPFHKDEKISLTIQVKSGPAYGETLPTGFKLKTTAIDGAKKKSASTCLFWVDRLKGLTFWSYIHPRTPSTVKIYGSHHEVNPASAYDLCRCIVMKEKIGSTGGRGIIVGKIQSNIQTARREAKTKYRNYQTVESPLFGNIHITRLGWRHMLRCSRNRKYKEQSLRLFAYLGKMLPVKPSEHTVLSCFSETIGDWISRRTEHLLVYSEILIAESTGTLKRARVLVRVIEEIRFPSDWANRVMLSQMIQQKATLKSVYFKYPP